MEAKPLIDFSENSLYAQTLLAECIDEYIKYRAEAYAAEPAAAAAAAAAAAGSTVQQQQAFQTAAENTPNGIVPKTALRPSAFHAAVEEAVLQQLRAAAGTPAAANALGIALAAKRIQETELLLRKADNQVELLNYLSTNLYSLVSCKPFQREVLGLLVKLYKELLSSSSSSSSSSNGQQQQQQQELPPLQLDQPEVYRQLCRCLLLQGDTAAAAAVLQQMLAAAPAANLPKPQLLAYQIAFDLVDLEMPKQMAALLAHPLLAYPAVEEEQQQQQKVEEQQQQQQQQQQQTDEQQQEVQAGGAAAAGAAAGAAGPAAAAVPVAAAEDEDAAAAAAAAAAEEEERRAAESKDPYTRKLSVLRSILSGLVSLEFRLEVLNRKSQTDMHLLDMYKGFVDSRQSLLQQGLLLLQALQQSSTGCDLFLRRNLDWLKKAVSWAKFSATASIGAIHRARV
ncbi:26S proteasome subunit RPN2a, related [Eimeria tenella]|uniref:26S proteasome subunit RPN2a, related n=1 Tax=Eimeria tenella TaxID=5802 RepID=U6LAB5_EIMTE|nr:26S proteasome subunit RPN2a, related [Eimeria tenella]CDJ45474.1 26S proteasome subunit RPN2a, related [Eimeria tenella]|eukprot:XP_013236220.1 26S proteasome subunit RPN2a, related [Eimeria tenella]